MDPVLPWVDPGEMRRLAEALLSVAVHEPRASEDAGFGGDFIGFEGSSTRTSATPVAPVAAVAAVAAPAATTPLVRPASAAEEVVRLPISVPRPLIIASAPLRPQAPVHQNPASTSEAAKGIVPAAPSVETHLLNGAFSIREKSMLEQIAESSQRPQVQPDRVVVDAAMAAAQSIAPKPLPVATPSMQDPARPAPSAQSAPLKVRGPFLERMARFRDGLHGQFAAKGVFILDKDGSVIFDEGDHSRLHFMARSLAMAAKKSSDGPGNVHVKVGSTTMLEVIPIDTVFGRMVLGLLVEQPLASDSVVRIIKALQSMVAPPAA